MTRLNFTNRKSLKRKHVGVTLTRDRGRPPVFDVRLDLPDGLDGSARLFLEATRSSPPARMRFYLGTVADRRELTRDQRTLTAFADDKLRPPTFRLKVTDVTGTHALLQADARRLTAAGDDGDEGILFTSWREDQDELWRLELDDPDGPQLALDAQADPTKTLPDQSLFQATVYPAVVRRVLEHVLIDERGEQLDDEEWWHGRWVGWVRERCGYGEPLPGAPFDLDQQGEELRTWIDGAVGRVCRHWEMRERVRGHLQPEGDG